MDEPASILNTSKKMKKVDYQSVKDSFSLLLNYPDPFFKKKSYSAYQGMYSYGNSTGDRSSVAKFKPKKEVKPVPVIDWSFIHFKGTIKRHSTGKTLTLLNINGDEHAIEEGKVMDNVTLVKNCKDSILVKYNGVKKYIKKQ